MELVEITRKKDEENKERETKREKQVESLKDLQGLEIMTRVFTLLIVVIVSRPVYISSTTSNKRSRYCYSKKKF